MLLSRYARSASQSLSTGSLASGTSAFTVAAWITMQLFLVLAPTHRAVAAVDDAQAGALLQLEDVFALSYATAPIVSPGGEQVFYLRNSMDILKDQRRSNLWVVDADGSRNRPLTTGPRNVSAPALSPTGDRMAYVDRDDSAAQIFVRWLDGGELAQLTRGAETPKNLSWSPDGKQIAFSMRVPVEAPVMGKLPKAPRGAEWAPPPIVVDRVVYRNDGGGLRPNAFYQVFVLPADGGAVRQLTDGPYDHVSAIEWASDSSALFFSANRGDDRALNVANSDIFRLQLSSGEIRAVTTRQGPDGDSALSPDGKRIAFTGWDDQGLPYHVQRLYLMEATGGEPRELLSELDRSVENPQWSADGKRIFFQFDDRGDTVLAVTDLRGVMTRLASSLAGTTIGRPYSGAAFDVGGNDRYAFTLGSYARPADIALARGGDEPRQLTYLNENMLGQRELAAVEEMWVDSSADGQPVQAWVALPPGFDPALKYPLVLEIHGGPHTNYGSRFSTEVQLYAAAGYVVLYVNPRGSTSYGEDFANLIANNYPGEDYDDLMSAVDALIARGAVDPDQLYVTGGSGGGVLTAWIVGKTDRFRAAVVAKPVINWISFTLTADNSPYFSRYWFPGMPWEEPEHYWARSPLSLVGQVSTPTMLLTGEADLRTPVGEAEQYYQALKLRGVDTAMVRMPGASHSIAKRPSQLMAKVAAILAWFERYAPDDTQPVVEG
ncbi:MAG: dipeptidyl aminopeptidase/acylaminoacyl peptidase [Halieaceae bacterium]|jgi:dipeptidyl aminopeptidase/acylaminoacyl peptidase